jgi:hypothetical protein
MEYNYWGTQIFILVGYVVFMASIIMFLRKEISIKRKHNVKHRPVKKQHKYHR